MVQLAACPPQVKLRAGHPLAYWVQWFLRDEAQCLDEMMTEHPWGLTQVVLTVLEEHHPGLD